MLGPSVVPYRHESADRAERIRRQLSALREPLVNSVAPRHCMIWEWTNLELAMELIRELREEELLQKRRSLEEAG